MEVQVRGFGEMNDEGRSQEARGGNGIIILGAPKLEAARVTLVLPGSFLGQSRWCLAKGTTTTTTASFLPLLDSRPLSGTFQPHPTTEY